MEGWMDGIFGDVLVCLCFSMLTEKSIDGTAMSMYVTVFYNLHKICLF